MPKLTRTAVLFLLLAGTTGCYHATINTGRAPGGQAIQKPWAHSFIYGLVPPSVTETAAACPNGVAKVETQLSFLNMLASAVTFGIYSPMTITVQCAAAGGEPPADADVVQAAAVDAERALNEAVQRSARTGEPVWVDLE